jgi:uracil-DNA glycosylase
VSGSVQILPDWVDELPPAVLGILDCRDCQDMRAHYGPPQPPFWLKGAERPFLLVLGQCPGPAKDPVRLRAGGPVRRYAAARDEFYLSKYYREMRGLIGEGRAARAVWANASCCRNRGKASKWQVYRCFPRFRALVEWLQPDYVLAAGSVAHRAVESAGIRQYARMQHPGYIHRFERRNLDIITGRIRDQLTKLENGEDLW